MHVHWLCLLGLHCARALVVFRTPLCTCIGRVTFRTPLCTCIGRV